MGILVPMMFGLSLWGTEPTKSDNATAMELLTVLRMDKIYADSIEQIIQLQAQQNPGMASYSEVQRKFIRKYMSFESIKGDLARLYAEEFTEQEMHDLIAFYRTPVGIKTITKMPSLMAKGSQIGTERVKQNMGELFQMIRAEQERQQKTQPKK